MLKPSASRMPMYVDVVLEEVGVQHQSNTVRIDRRAQGLICGGVVRRPPGNEMIPRVLMQRQMCTMRARSQSAYWSCSVWQCCCSAGVLMDARAHHARVLVRVRRCSHALPDSRLLQ